MTHSERFVQRTLCHPVAVRPWTKASPFGLRIELVRTEGLDPPWAPEARPLFVIISDEIDTIIGVCHKPNRLCGSE